MEEEPWRKFPEYKKRFSMFLADSGALFFADGLFLKDGRPTPYFVNAGKFNSGKMSSKLGDYYAYMLIEKDIAKDVDIVMGPSYKGSAIANGTAIALWRNHGINVLFDYDRKESKEHGESSKEESLLVNKTLSEGSRIFIEDDVWTSGATKYDFIEKIEAEAERQGYNVVIIGMGLAVDREQVSPIYDKGVPKDLKGKELTKWKREHVVLGERGEDAIRSFIDKTRIPVHSVMGIMEIVGRLYYTKCPLMINGEVQTMDAHTFEEFNQYMETYGVRK